MKTTVHGLIAALALAGLSACETSNPADDGGGQAQGQACNYDRNNAQFNDLAKAIETQGVAPAATRTWVQTNKAKIEEIATEADRVRGGMPLGEVACRRVSVVAWGALMPLDAERERVRVRRFEVAQKGEQTCQRLSDGDKREGSAQACSLFTLYRAAQGAGVELDRVLRVSSGQPASKPLLDEVRQSAERLTASVRDSWKDMPAAGPFQEAARAEKQAIACPMSARVQRLMQANGPDGVTDAARALAAANAEMEAAVAASLGTTLSGYSAMCLDYLNRTSG